MLDTFDSEWTLILKIVSKGSVFIGIRNPGLICIVHSVCVCTEHLPTVGIF